MKNKDKIFIYGLHTNGEDIRYIGKTNKQDINLRLRQHILKSRDLKTHRDRWIQKSINEGKSVKIKEIEVVNNDNWSDREKYWIKHYRKVGNLTNHSDGGDGGAVILYTKSYDEVKEWVQKNLNFKSSIQWNRGIKDTELPWFVPSNPRTSYLNRGWVSWGDFLGTGNKHDNDVNYLTYDEAKKYIKENLSHLDRVHKWKIAAKKSEIPSFIPNRPERYYNHDNRGWIGYGDFLGTGRVSNENKVFAEYSECVEYVRKLDIKTMNEWVIHCSSGLKPEGIPSNPNTCYKDSGWVSWGEFLGSGRVSDNQKHDNYLSYKESKTYIKNNHSLIKSSCQWNDYFKTKNNYLPENIPLNPQLSFKNKGWEGWGKFLDSGNIRNSDKVFPSYEEAKKSISKFKLKSNKEWRVFSKKECKRLGLPTAPDRAYKNNGWTSWGDFLGNNKVSNSKKSFPNYDEAREIISELNIKSNKWKAFAKKECKRLGLPTAPDVVYKDKGWVNWSHWFGNA